MSSNYLGIRFSIDNSYTKQSTPCTGTVQSLQKQKKLICFVLPIKYVHVHPTAAISNIMDTHGTLYNFKIHCDW